MFLAGLLKGHPCGFSSGFQWNCPLKYVRIFNWHSVYVGYSVTRSVSCEI